MADFILGRLKFKWQGNWNSDRAYVVDDIVKYGANTYVCVTNHTSGSNDPAFYGDLSAGKWNLHTEGLRFLAAEHTASTFYKLNDVVKFGSQQYRVTTQHESDSTGILDTSKFAVYNEGLQFENSWEASTYYQDGDIVTYGGYSYTALQNHSGQTPSGLAPYWEVLTTGFNATGDYNAATAYKTGDTMQFGGWSYVCETDTSAGQTPASHPAKWEVINEGFKWNGNYSGSYTYQKGDVVEYSTSSYVAIAYDVLNVLPTADATKWNLMSQGDSNNVLTFRGDIMVKGASQNERLHIGPKGSVLTTDGVDVKWGTSEDATVKYVANNGLDTNEGTKAYPFKTIKKALSVVNHGDVVDFDTQAGGSGGTPGVYNAVTGTSGGSGTDITARVTIDGSSTPLVEITDGGHSHAVGDTITIASGSIGGNTNITFRVKSVNVGDIIFVKNGVYREELPLRVPPNITVKGESLRGTQVRPASGNGTQIATINNLAGGTGGTPGAYHFKHTTSSGTGQGCTLSVVKDGSSIPTVVVYSGGFGYSVGETITVAASEIGGGVNLTCQVASVELNNASKMWLMNNNTNLETMSFQGLTGTPANSGGTGKAAVVSLDPTGNISTASPYCQNCTSVNAGATGIEIDGALHRYNNPNSNISILGNDFTQINSDGRGVHALNNGRGEMVSIFTYYCDKSFYTSGGGFIRGLNCSSAYGEEGAVAEGEYYEEVPVEFTTRGRMLEFNSTSFVGGSNDENNLVIGQTLSGNTSGATATIFFLQTSAKYIYIESVTGTFTKGETVTATKADSSTYTFNLTTNFGVPSPSTQGDSGIQGFLVPIKSTDGTLSSTGVIKLASNFFTGYTGGDGDSTYYRITQVSDEDTSAQTAIIKINPGITSVKAKADGTTVRQTIRFSNVRLTGHDFLDIGTGSFTDTNYPNNVGQTQPADQDDEVHEREGGRVYFTSTDQKGDFRVGNLFKIQQATGIATLNADAFDLSGLTELQLGSIGASLGATINEFSTDETMAGDSTTSVPVERSIVGYTQRQKMGVGHLTVPIGTTAQRPSNAGTNLFAGGIRFNTDKNTWEGYNNTAQWTGLSGFLPWSTVIGDGSTVTTLSVGSRVFVNTSAAKAIIKVPASPQIGDTVRIVDLGDTFSQNNCDVQGNGEKIMGLSATFVISTDNAGIALVYTGTAQGWKLETNV